MYHALYRKYRPKDFNSVVGQDSIIRTLKNSIVNKKISHAYMFFGPRGIGKTTVSKIFARNINCDNPEDGMACKKCKNCEVSFSKNCVDIIEIDAASNNGVDEIRELKNKINLVPSELKYKVYIIDEVHMLSIGAFNALLKTLEEPPEHAIFILATTDPQKVPETIISRCQCFSFKRISENIIKQKLVDVCQEEKILIEEEVLNSIAILSDGGLRDALGFLDKLTSYTKDKITMQDFTDINGIVSEKEIYELIEDILKGNIKNVLIKINLFNDNGKNLIQIIIQILNISRNLLVDFYINNKNINLSLENLQELANIINEKMFDIKKSGNPKIFIEMLFIKFINKFILSNQKNVTKERIINMENNKANLNEYSEKCSNEDKENNEDNENNENEELFQSNKQNEQEDAIKYPKILNIDEIMKARINNTMALASKSLLKEELSKFELLKEYTFDQEIGYLVCTILDSKLRTVSPNSIIISYEFDSTVKQTLMNIELLNKIYNRITNSNKKIAIISDDEWNKIKKQYIDNLKNNIKYNIVDEPEVIFEELTKDDIIKSNTAVELFGDIVEID